MERLVSKEDEKLFEEYILNFLSDKEWTISNFNDASQKIIKYMEKNAVLNELTIAKLPVRKES